MESGWRFSKHEVRAAHGVVAAKHPLAARAGLAMLQRGGNAVDAAVAAAFAVGVVEPWMSGLGGGGILVVHREEASGFPMAVEFGMRAPGAAHAEMYDLEEGYDQELFGWRRVRGEANIHGWRSIAVPGVPAGLALTLARFGTMPLAEVLQPAIALARNGFPLDWTTTLQITLDAGTLRRYPSTAALFLEDGLPPVPSQASSPRLFRQPDLARTLEAIAAEGPDAFYRGPVGRRIAEHVQRAGGIMTEDDLAGYEASLGLAHVCEARHHEVMIVPGPTGGTTLAEIVNILGNDPLRALGHNTIEYLHLLIEATRASLADRLTSLAEGARWELLTSRTHAAARRAGISAERAGTWTLAAADPTSTTHLCAADRHGMLVSLTQTLLSRFGSRVVVPGTGVLLNNGMMWFDPEPGRLNSIAPNRRPLANMTPAVVSRAGRPILAVGASGGRKIIDAVLQIILNVVEFGMGVQDAIAAPRIDASTAEVLVDERIPQQVQEGLRRLGHPVAAVAEGMAPRFFASPVAIGRDPERGELIGGVDPYHPAVAAGY